MKPLIVFTLLWSLFTFGLSGAVPVIVIPEQPEPVSKVAAEELAKHLGLALGAEVAILTEGTEVPAGAVVYWVGPTQRAAEAGIEVADLASEEVIVRRAGNDLIITGQDQPGDPWNPNFPWVGTLWGVYEVLERDYNVVWAFPGDLGTVVPRVNEIQMGEWDEQFAPKLVRRRLREVSRNHDLRLGYTAETREAYLEAERKHLRRHRIGRSTDPRPYAGHSFGSWWQQYKETNPEFFQMNADGSRGPRDGRAARVAMCVSNPDLHQEILRRFIEARKQRPDSPPIINLGENDVHQLCQCEYCMAWDDPQPTEEEYAALPRYAQSVFFPRSGSGRYARFWKAVHDLAVEVEPDVVITAFLYSRYFAAPTTDIELHPNIILSFAPWAPRGPTMNSQRSWLYPRFDNEQEWLMDQWDGWRATGATLYYRPNYTLDGYAMPHNYAGQFAETFSHFLDNGAIGFDFDSLLGQWAVQGPTMYLLTRMHQKPKTPVEELLDEYYSAFGPAADQVKAYFQYWEDHTLALRDTEDELMLRYGLRRISFYARWAHEWFPAEAIAESETMLQEALKSIPNGESNDVYLERIQYLLAGLEGARLCTVVAEKFVDESTSPAERQAALNQLAQFRIATAELFLANYHWIHRVETTAWGQMQGFFTEE